MRFSPVPQHLLIEWLNGLARVPNGGQPVVRTGVQVSVFSERLHCIPRTYPRFWAGLRALKLPIYPFFGPAYRPGPPRFIRTAGRPLCVYSGVLLDCIIEAARGRNKRTMTSPHLVTRIYLRPLTASCALPPSSLQVFSVLHLRRTHQV